MICVGISGDAYIRGYGLVMKLDGDHESRGRDRKSSDRKFMERLSTRRAERTSCRDTQRRVESGGAQGRPVWEKKQ